MPSRCHLLLLCLLALPTCTHAQPAASFTTDGLAFLEKHCLRCHGDKVKKAELSLHTFRTEASLLGNRKAWQKVLDAVNAGDMPPASRPRPTLAELDAFKKSVSAVFARADRLTGPDPGRVTIRRLNRTEYNNTIRDLVGVDFQPAEDFPSDDVGHGFDNIGDVLTLSPVLMERYLAAAESIVQRAILVNPPKPPERHLASRWLEPSQPKDFRFRPLDPRGNMLHTPYKLTLGGDYVFRFRAYAQMIDKEPVRVAIVENDRELKQIEVTAPKEKPGTFEVKVNLPAGEHRFFVKLLNPAGMGENSRTIHVEWFHLAGPSDTRPDTHRQLLAATPGKAQAEQTREVLTRFANRAYRRPASKEEIDRLAGLVDAAMKRGDKWEAGIQLALQAVLVSPKFLFRVELDDRPSEAKPHPIDEYQLASRLSYFLWASMPDDELFALAAKKQLTSNLDAQVRRMLRDPRAKSLVNDFAMQWLQLRRLETHAADPKLFPTFNDQLRSSMVRETKFFFWEIIREDRGILDLIDADYTYLDDVLARHYGIRDTAGNRTADKKPKPGGKPIGRDFVRVSLSDGQRGGLLTQASVLTVTSNPTRTSPVKRGKWVLEQILGTPPPPPPPNVPELAENDKAQLTGSLRQRMEQHRKNPACANCHTKMDALGFAFENFDAIGAWRTRDGNFPIDAAGTLPEGKTFNGPAELKAILKEKKDLVAGCLTEKLLIYALGRGVEHYDRPALEAISTAVAKNDYKFSTLVTEIVKSMPFRMRRGKDQNQ